MSEPIKTTVYGTAEDCDVRITDDRYVSSHHAKITEYADGKTWVEDLGSTNGTYWNGAKIWRCAAGRSGRIRVGRTELAWTATPHPATEPADE